MDIIHEAYLNWKSQYKILLRTFSEEQLFAHGFQAANKVNDVMQEVVADLQHQVADLTERLAKLDKPKKTAKADE
jgi:hypothetical protein